MISNIRTVDERDRQTDRHTDTLNKLRLPADHEDLSLSSDLTHVSSSFPASPLSPSITPSHFHSRLKTHLFHKSFPP